MKAKATEKEARAAVKVVLLRLFDIPSVVRGKKKLSELTGLPSLMGTLGIIFVRMGVTTLQQNMSRKMVGSMYLRDGRTFVVDLAKQMAVSLLACCVSATSFWFRRRTEIAWRNKLTRELHSSYFKEMVYFRQALTPGDQIEDPGQRIVRDVTMMTQNLVQFCTSTVSGVLEATYAVSRLVYYMPGRAYYVPLIIFYTYSMLYLRNIVDKPMNRGMLTAKISRVSGAYRDAHTKLATHAEAILSFGGVAAEARRVRSKLEDSLNVSREMIRVMLYQDLAKGLFRSATMMTFTQLLYQIPVLSDSHPMKVSASAPEALRMQSNANLLAYCELQHKRQLSPIFY